MSPSIFDSRKTTKRSSSESSTNGTDRQRNGVYYTSKMQGILAIKDTNEEKAATYLSEYLIYQSEKTLDKAVLAKSIGNMLTGFTIEEQNRILTKALINALVKIV